MEIIEVKSKFKSTVSVVVSEQEVILVNLVPLCGECHRSFHNCNDQLTQLCMHMPDSFLGNNN